MFAEDSVWGPRSGHGQQCAQEHVGTFPCKLSVSHEARTTQTKRPGGLTTDCLPHARAWKEAQGGTRGEALGETGREEEEDTSPEREPGYAEGPTARPQAPALPSVGLQPTPRKDKEC